jgi:tRNA pseudouridine55 synthase
VTAPTRKKRVPVHGVLLLDKEAGLSSNDALMRAKRLLNAEKAGHTGTLDPFATGLLPLCFGEATKFAQDLLDADKHYETLVQLGVTTETGDTEGKVLQVRTPHVDLAQLELVLTKFRGEIAQVPPMYSALKRDGKALYEYARAGVTVEREARKVSIHSLELLALDLPWMRLRVSCSKGTYVRVLGEDIGAALGCGAHLNQLRRTGVGALRLDKAVTLEQLERTPEELRAGLLAPVDHLLSTFPAVTLDDVLALRFTQGQRLPLAKEGEPVPQPGRVRVYQGSDGRLLGTAKISEYGVLAPERLVSLSR